LFDGHRVPGIDQRATHEIESLLRALGDEHVVGLADDPPCDQQPRDLLAQSGHTERTVDR
jgi:hypothetical protein